MTRWGAIQSQSAPKQPPAVLTVEEAALVLRIGRTAAYAAARSGELPVIRVGRSLRVPRHRLDQLLGLQNDNDPAGNRAEVEDSAVAATDAGSS
jgi:excisionase family DNA binding protein